MASFQSSSSLSLPLPRETGSKWQAVDWGAVMAGKQIADKLFLRSGIVRKDLIPQFIGRHTPHTWLCQSFEEVNRLICYGEYRTCEETEEDSVTTINNHQDQNNPTALLLNDPIPDELDKDEHKCSFTEWEPEAWVIKYADSSNAFGILFVPSKLQREEALEVVRNAMALDNDPRVVQAYIPPLLLSHPLKEAITISSSSESSPTSFLEDIDDDGVDGVSESQNRKAAISSTKPIPKIDENFRGHKFHIRVMALVVGVLEVYVFDECRVLISPQTMQGGNQLMDGFTSKLGQQRHKGESEINAIQSQSTENEINFTHAHITNRGFNQQHSQFREVLHIQALSKCQALGDLIEIGDLHGVKFANKKGNGIWAQIRRICTSLFARLGSDKKRFFVTPNTYELFGLDFVIDRDGKAWLLEANPDPSLGMFKEDESILRTVRPIEAVKTAEPLTLASGWALFKQNTQTNDESEKLHGQPERAKPKTASIMSSQFTSLPLSDREWQLIYSSKSIDKAKLALCTLEPDLDDDVADEDVNEIKAVGENPERAPIDADLDVD